ncbi:MAG: O-antigen ligase family protein, partial [bacterium]
MLVALLASLFISIYLMFPLTGDQHLKPFDARLTPWKIARDMVLALGAVALILQAWRRAQDIAGDSGGAVRNGGLRILIRQLGISALPLLVYLAMLALVELAGALLAGDRSQMLALGVGLRNLLLFSVVTVAVALTVRPCRAGHLLDLLGYGITAVAAIGLLEILWPLIHNPAWDTNVGGASTLRITSTLPDHLRCGIVCALGVAYWSARLPFTQWTGKRRRFLLAAAAYLACAAALAATGTRAPAAAAVLVVITAALIRRRRGLIFLLLVLLIGALAASPGTRNRLLITFQEWSRWGRPVVESDVRSLREDVRPDAAPGWEPPADQDRTVSSTRQRLTTVRLAYDNFRTDGTWLFGAGLGRSAPSLRQVFGVEILPLESAVLNLTYETGLVGLLCGLMFVLGPVWPRRTRRHVQDTGGPGAGSAWSAQPVRTSLLAMLVVLVVSSLTYETTAGFPVNLLFATVIG